MGRIVHKASCQWRKISVGRNVHGTIFHGRVVMGRVVHGARCDGASGPGLKTVAPRRTDSYPVIGRLEHGLVHSCNCEARVLAGGAICTPDPCWLEHGLLPYSCYR
jgi:hypothetical protein